MKRFLCLLLLCLCLALPALAADLPLFPVKAGDEIVGLSVLAGSSYTLLTTVPIGNEALYVVTPDGDVSVSAFPQHDTLLTVLQTFQELPGTPLILGSASAEGLTYVGVNLEGEMVEGLASFLAPVDQPSGLTLTAAPYLLPGAVLVNSEGDLCGMICASLGEGIGRYFALGASDIYTRLMYEEYDESENTDFFAAKATIDRNRVILDWSGDPNASEDSLVCVYWYDEENDYYTYRTVQGLTDTLRCVPGRSYSFFVRPLLSEDDNLTNYSFPEGARISLTLSEASPYKDYHFLDTQAYIACLPQGETAGDTDLLPALENLEDVFDHQGYDLYLQVVSTYEVTEMIEADLTIVLYTPDGSCYMYPSGFLFGPEYMSNDVWHANITELFDEAADSLPDKAGVYYLRYYINDGLASEIRMELD